MTTPQHDTDGFDPQRIVWRMVDQPIWLGLWLGLWVRHASFAPNIEPSMNQALANVAWLCDGRVDL